MSAQGKMHSSPFHVETVGYMSKVEHGDSTFVRRQRCLYCMTNNKLCHCPKSEYYQKRCMDFKCTQFEPYKTRDRCKLWKEGTCMKEECTPDDAVACKSFLFAKGCGPRTTLKKKKKK